jgi:hypothetical protein
MRKILVAVAFAALALSLPAAPAQAQATRTWVSGVGDDANPCSRTAPCKTWAGAISKTAPGGEIDALDPGGFGAVTITKSITFDGGGGQVASVLVAGVNGIIVAPATNDVVILRNLRLDGLLGNGSNSANAGTNAIRVTGGRQVVIENVNVFGFSQNCIDIEPTANLLVVISNSSVTNCGAAGVLVAPGGGAGVSVNVSIYNLMAFNAVDGVKVNGTSAGNTQAQVFNSNITGMSTSGVTALTSTAATNIFVHNSMISRASTGVISNGATQVHLSQTVVTNNTVTALSTLNGGGITTYHSVDVGLNPGGQGATPTQANPL